MTNVIDIRNELIMKQIRAAVEHDDRPELIKLMRQAIEVNEQAISKIRELVKD